MKLPGEAIASSVQGPWYDPQWHKTTEAKQKNEHYKFYASSTPTNKIHKQGVVVQFCTPALGRQGR